VQDDVTAVGWLFLHPAAVPEEWKDRTRPAVFVALDEDEIRSLLVSGSIDKTPTGVEDELLPLIARGLSASAIARRTKYSERTVHRRIAHLRDRYGVGSTPELAAELARRGF
jgi:DNA-binding NarL/FixJ family response regulator